MDSRTDSYLKSPSALFEIVKQLQPSFLDDNGQIKPIPLKVIKDVAQSSNLSVDGNGQVEYRLSKLSRDGYLEKLVIKGTKENLGSRTGFLVRRPDEEYPYQTTSGKADLNDAAELYEIIKEVALQRGGQSGTKPNLGIKLIKEILIKFTEDKNLTSAQTKRDFRYLNSKQSGKNGSLISKYNDRFILNELDSRQDHHYAIIHPEIRFYQIFETPTSGNAKEEMLEQGKADAYQFAKDDLDQDIRELAELAQNDSLEDVDIMDFDVSKYTVNELAKDAYSFEVKKISDQFFSEHFKDGGQFGENDDAYDLVESQPTIIISSGVKTFGPDLDYDSQIKDIYRDHLDLL